MKNSRILQINTRVTEYEYLINCNDKISNFYMNTKLCKSKELNEKIKSQNSGYINITENLQIEVLAIVAGPVCYTIGISEILRIILEPSLSLDTICSGEALLSSCGIKSLHTNICNDVFYKAIDYWIEKLITEIPSQR